MRPYTNLVDRLPGVYPESVNVALDRYLELMSHPPELSEAEWNLLRDVLNGTYTQGEPTELVVQALAFEVEDAIRLRAVDQYHGVDVEALLSRLRSFSPVETLAIVHAVERWWDAQSTDSDPEP